MKLIDLIDSLSPLDFHNLDLIKEIRNKVTELQDRVFIEDILLEIKKKSDFHSLTYRYFMDGTVHVSITNSHMELTGFGRSEKEALMDLKERMYKI